MSISKTMLMDKFVLKCAVLATFCLPIPFTGSCHDTLWEQLQTIHSGTGAGDTLQKHTPAPLSLEDAATLLHSNNNPLKISEKGVELATAQKRQLNAAWYPAISTSGGYAHFSNGISVEGSTGKIVESLVSGSGLEELLGQLLPQLAPQIQQIISGLGTSTFSVPVLDNDISTIDATAVWPLATGGKRIYANRIGKEGISAAQSLLQLTENAQMALMLNCYYTLKLCSSISRMEQENCSYMNRLLHNASKLCKEGFINKSELLIVQVAQKEAQGRAENALQQQLTAQHALEAVLATEIGNTELTGSYFTLDSLPDIGSITEQIMTYNPTLKLLEHSADIVANQKNIARSSYFPTVAIFARQNIHSYNFPKNLAPRTMAGALMQWDIFDGFAREKEIEKQNIEYSRIQLALEQARLDLQTAAIALVGDLSDARNNMATLQEAVAFSNELLREREKGFAEGMCTSTDVVEARNTLMKSQTALETANWQYCTALADLLALYSNTSHFILLHNEYRK